MLHFTVYFTKKKLNLKKDNGLILKGQAESSTINLLHISVHIYALMHGLMLLKFIFVYSSGRYANVSLAGNHRELEQGRRRWVGRVGKCPQLPTQVL